MFGKKNQIIIKWDITTPWCSRGPDDCAHLSVPPLASTTMVKNDDDDIHEATEIGLPRLGALIPGQEEIVIG